MFTHLHVHTEYSLLDGMCRIPQLVARAKELGMTQLAVTDHGAMYGVIEFYQAAREAGLKPIIGSEVYIAPGSRLSRQNGDKNNYHIVLLVKNQTGYQNLIQLVTKAHLEGFYYKPRVDKELLKQHHEGLVALSACLAGEIPQLILARRFDEAKQAARWYQETFGDFYLEIMRHPIPELEEVNARLIEMGRELAIPLVATSDVHYVNQEDASAHDLLLCIGTNASVKDEKRLKMAGDFFYLKSAEEMGELFRDIPEALENTGKIANMCNLELEFGRLHLPEISLPAGQTPDEYLADICRRNLPRYYPKLTPEIEQRLEYELDVIRKTEFANYFLVVWDIISFVRENNILFGVRGSAAASIVLHCLGITPLDPLEHGLVFERFLNIERKEMPDIDMDFQDDRRDEVIAYVSRKYGQDHVAQIITFGTLGARAAIRDVGRALGMTYGDVDRVARLVPNAPNMTLARAMEENAELKGIYHDDEIVRHLVNSAARVEGIARHASTHAAGVVIAREPLTEHVPLQRGSRAENEEAVMTQFSMGDIARIGLLKMDFLGLANLTILGRAREVIRRHRGVDVDFHDLPLDDKKTYELLSAGETAGVFQLEGAGMRRYIKDLKPTVFSDIASMVALYRPGPMENIPTFIRAKHGLEPIHYPHPALESILKETYGVIVFQEQVLFIVRALAGYSLGQADIFRKAMGKKIPEVMKKERRNFLAGAREKGFSEESAAAVFDLIEPFAGYAFNKAHSVSYALIAYQTAYFKANYPAEYITAFLAIHAGQAEKVASAAAECRRLGIEVLPPDINRSQVNFSIEDVDGKPAIRFGLAAIKNVGLGAVEPIVAEREKNGPYKSVEDLCRRCDLRAANRRVMESIIKTGAFDRLQNRGTLLKNVERIVSLAQREQRLRETGQSTMFDLFGQTAPVPLAELDMAPAEATDREKAAWEKELLGVAFSEKPFSPVLADAEAIFCGQIDVELEGQNVVVAGRVVTARYLLTRDGRSFASAILEDFSGRIETMVWPKVFAETADLWQEGNELVIQGKVRLRDSQAQLSCDSVRRYQPSSEAPPPATSPVLPEKKTVEVTPKNGAAVKKNGNGAKVNNGVARKNGAFVKKNGVAAKSNGVVANKSTEVEKKVEPTAPPAVKRRLIISLSQTDDENRDVARLNRLVSLLREYPGRDEVHLSIASGGEVTNLRLSGLTTNFCPELKTRMEDIIGDSYKVEKVG